MAHSPESTSPTGANPALARRFERNRRDIRSAFEFRNESIPFIVNDVNYWLDGDDPERIPADYFERPASMVGYQLRKIDHHLRAFDDAYIPFLHPWYGVGVVPTALGCQVHIPARGDPALKSTVLRSPGDIRGLRRPDPHRDGLMPRVLETIDYMVQNTRLPVCVTDTQGPLSIALGLCGVENLYVWMRTDPEDAHRIMAFCTDVLIDWIKVQKEHAGLEPQRGAWPHGIWLPEGFGGVCLSDDDCTTLSPDLYAEFVVPYNSRVLREFGGGTIHFCGTAAHQIENFLRTEGLTGINNFCMGHFEQVRRMQEAFADRIALMVCDFAPLDFDTYLRSLTTTVTARGTIFAVFVASEFALVNGSYAIVHRDAHQTASEIYETLARAPMMNAGHR